MNSDKLALQYIDRMNKTAGAGTPFKYLTDMWSNAWQKAIESVYPYFFRSYGWKSYDKVEFKKTTARFVVEGIIDPTVSNYPKVILDTSSYVDGTKSITIVCKMLSPRGNLVTNRIDISMSDLLMHGEKDMVRLIEGNLLDFAKKVW